MFVRRLLERMGVMRPRRKVTAPLCYQCGRPAMMGYQQGDGSVVPMCLDHAMMVHRMFSERIQQKAETINFLMDAMDDVAGHPRSGARFQTPVTPIIQAGGIHLTRINASNSNIGVLNTGKIESIDTAIGYLSDTGGKPIAQALKAMTEAVIVSNETNSEQKGELLELLGVLASEASVPREKRKSKAMLPIIAQVSGIISATNALTQLWAKYAPAIKAFFGLT